MKTGLTFYFLWLLTALPAFSQLLEVERPFELGGSDEDKLFHLHAGWDSSYYTEGRDALDDAGLFITTFEFTYEWFAAGAWYGLSDKNNYDELQTFVALTHSFGDLEVYASYTHFEFFKDDEDDNEVGLGFLYSGLPVDLEFGGDAYYSFESDGTFFEAYLGRETELSEKLAMTNVLKLGANDNYVSEGHDGLNHFVTQIAFDYELSESVNLHLHCAYSWAIDRDFDNFADDELLKNFFHGGLGLHYEF